MIILNTDTKSLELKLSGATTTNPVEWSCSWVEETSTCCGTINATICSDNGETQGTVSSGSAVEICAAPTSPSSANDTITKEIEFISVYNSDTVTANAVLQINNSGTPIIIFKAILLPGYTLIYNEDSGFVLYSNTGAPVTVANSVSSITIGDPVTGGVAASFLYVNGSGNLDQLTLSGDSTQYISGTGTLTTPLGMQRLDQVLGQGNVTSGHNLLVSNGDFISSDGGAIQLDFGSGAYFKATTDAGLGYESTIYIDSTHAQVSTADGMYYINASNAIVQHSTQIVFDSPLYNFAQLTASTVPYLNGSKNLVSSAVTPTELGYVSGVTSAIQTQFSGVTTSLAGKQPLDSDLTSWAAITRASGFDTLVATPSSANLASLITDETGSGSLVFANTPTLVTPVLGAATGTSLVLSSKIDEAKGADIASAATTNIGAATGNYVNITGTTTITAFDTIQAGAKRILQFNGALTLTHNGTSLILPGAANIVTAAGDVAEFISLGSGNWKCTLYTPYNTGYTDWIPTITGCSVNPTGITARYFIVGKMCTCYFTYTGNGTSNATSKTITLPFAAANTGVQIFTICPTDNGTLAAAAGRLVTRVNSSIADLWKTLAGAATWTGSGACGFPFSITYEMA